MERNNILWGTTRFSSNCKIENVDVLLSIVSHQLPTNEATRSCKNGRTSGRDWRRYSIPGHYEPTTKECNKADKIRSKKDEKLKPDNFLGFPFHLLRSLWPAARS